MLFFFSLMFSIAMAGILTWNHGQQILFECESVPLVGLKCISRVGNLDVPDILRKRFQIKSETAQHQHIVPLDGFFYLRFDEDSDTLQFKIGETGEWHAEMSATVYDYRRIFLKLGDPSPMGDPSPGGDRSPKPPSGM